MTVAPVLLFLLPLHGPVFSAGPSVRVTPNVEVEFEWITDVNWFGEVAVFDNVDATGTPVFIQRNEDALGNPIHSTQHTVTINAGGVPLAQDTGYFFKVTATDPTGSTPSFSTPTPLPPFFTGTQAIGNVSVVPDFDSAVISWDANVIGFGQVEYGITTPGDIGTVLDNFNATDHSIQLIGLSPGTTYQFRVSNLHAIDGDALASATGSFTTLGEPVPEPSAFVAWAGLAVVGLFFTRMRTRLAFAPSSQGRLRLVS